MRYWAGARAAAGRDDEVVEAATVADLRASVSARSQALASAVSVSSLLVDGLTCRDDALELRDGQVVEVLPPFAGG